MQFVMILLPLVILGAVLGVAAGRGRNLFKRQSAAWVLTAMMVVAAVGIGYAKAPFNNPKPEDVPAPPTNAPIASVAPPAPTASSSVVWDDANVLSSRTKRTLDERNDRLWDNYGVVVGVVTCNYGYDDLDEYGRDCAVEMGLGDYDMIVVLDISGDNYWLLRGAGLEQDFSDQACADYAYDYMEEWFAAGDYDFAVCQLTEMLELWYGTYYG